MQRTKLSSYEQNASKLQCSLPGTLQRKGVKGRGGAQGRSRVTVTQGRGVPRMRWVSVSQASRQPMVRVGRHQPWVITGCLVCFNIKMWICSFSHPQLSLSSREQCPCLPFGWHWAQATEVCADQLRSFFHALTSFILLIDYPGNSGSIGVLRGGWGQGPGIILWRSDPGRHVCLDPSHPGWGDGHGAGVRWKWRTGLKFSVHLSCPIFENSFQISKLM